MSIEYSDMRLSLKSNVSHLRAIKALGGYCSRVPPLPIPNREVKPTSADGTVKTGE